MGAAMSDGQLVIEAALQRCSHRSLDDESDRAVVLNEVLRVTRRANRMSSFAEKRTHTNVDTIEFSRADAEKWEIPGFQRPLKVNARLLAISDEIKLHGGVIPGMITLGKVGKTTYLIDGQHRRHAFLLTDCPMGYADVRMLNFADMGEMGEEFVRLNSCIVQLKADDVLRGMEGTTPNLATLRKRCSFIGYDSIRRSDKGGPVVSMSALLRVWLGSETECPVAFTKGARDVALSMTAEETQHLCKFANCVFDAWGRSEDSKRLWSSLNLALCAWLWRRCVIAPPHLLTSAKRWTRITPEEFKLCMMGLAADPHYNDWLSGRSLAERNRSPAMDRIRKIVAKRLCEERGVAKVFLPTAAWMTGAHGHAS